MEKIFLLLLLLLLFLAGGVSPLDPSTRRKFYLITQEKSWPDAHTYCRSKHTDMATIRSDADMIQIQTETQRCKFSSSAWIGLYNDIDSWRWSLRNETLGTERKWAVGCPNNLGGNRECGSISEFEVWEDFPCTANLPFVCFDESYTGTDRYIFYNDLKTWHEAQTYCRETHTDLARSRDQSEHTDIMGKTPDWTRIWIGLFRDSWKWTDQTNISSVRWDTGCPNNIGWDENCGLLNNGLADDWQCAYPLPFFCYRVKTGQQQILRVKVQSDQNANDPAVKAAILKQIHQRPEALGVMQNVTVKWREQPDGLVFHKLEKYNTTLPNITTKPSGF